MALQIEGGSPRHKIAQIRAILPGTLLQEVATEVEDRIKRTARRRPSRGTNAWPIRVKPVRSIGYTGGRSRRSFYTRVYPRRGIIEVRNRTGYAYFVEYARRSPHRGILGDFLRRQSPSILAAAVRQESVANVIDPNREGLGSSRLASVGVSGFAARAPREPRAGRVSTRTVR